MHTIQLATPQSATSENGSWRDNPGMSHLWRTAICRLERPRSLDYRLYGAYVQAPTRVRQYSHGVVIPSSQSKSGEQPELGCDEAEEEHLSTSLEKYHPAYRERYSDDVGFEHKPRYGMAVNGVQRGSQSTSYPSSIRELETV